MAADEEEKKRKRSLENSETLYILLDCQEAVNARGRPGYSAGKPEGDRRLECHVCSLLEQWCSITCKID